MTLVARIGRALVLSIAAALALPHVASADPVADAVRRGDAVGARQALEAGLEGRPDADRQRAMLEGLIALQAGNAAQAATIFREILRSDPEFEPARQHLSVTLMRLGALDEAAHHARRLDNTTESDRLREAILSQVTRARTAKPGGVSLRFALLPSTNITGGTATDTVFIGDLPFTLDPASREAAGIGVTVGATAWRSWQMGQDWRATVSASLDGRYYDSKVKVNEHDAGVALTFARIRNRGSIAFGPRLDVLFQDGGLARRRIGIGLSGDRAASRRLRYRFALAIYDQDFPDAPFRNGILATGSAGLSWRAGRNLNLSLALSGERETADASHLAHRDLGVSVGADLRLGKTILGIDGFIGRNRYDSIFPGFGVARRDEVSSLRLSISDSRIGWKNLTPEFSITRARQSSNIPLHDTRSTDLGLTFVTRF